MARVWGGLAKDGDDHPGAEGDEELFTRAVEHREHIIQPVFAVQLEVHLRRLGLFRLHGKHERCRHSQPDGCQDERSLEGETQEVKP